MEINLSACDSIFSQIDECVSTVNQDYECEWDDSVHDSFQNYITEAEGYFREIREATVMLKESGEVLESVDIDTLSEECETVMEEVEAI